MNKILIALVFLACFLYACEECDVNETECRGNDVYQCYSNGQWEKILDCDAVIVFDDIAEHAKTEEWVCEIDSDGEAGCLNPDGGTDAQ